MLLDFFPIADFFFLYIHVTDFLNDVIDGIYVCHWLAVNH